MRLKGKRAVVTGGAMGIGRATVEKFLAEGADVLFIDINEAASRQTVSELAGRGSVDVVIGSVTSEEDVRRALAEAELRWGAVDILVNNAGINAYFDATTMTEAEWEQVFAVDLKGAWLCAKYAIPLMRRAGGGSIVNIASIHSFQTFPNYFPYAAAKAGLVGLTKSLALDFGPEGVRVNAICPGYTRTQLVDEWLGMQENAAALVDRIHECHALRRMGEPSEVANVVAFVASDEASFMTGSAVVIDGGLTSRYPS